MLTVHESHLPGLRLLHRGKVRDLYELDEQRLLMVATDRLSAFDVVLPDPIPGKGAVLTEVSRFWCHRLAAVCPNHLLDEPPEALLGDPAAQAQVRGRAQVVRRVNPLPVEAIARGYLAGSGWKDYQATGRVCGIALPPGLRQAEQLPQPLFTPSTKAPVGDHDENVAMEVVAQRIGEELAQRIRELTLEIYRQAAAYAAVRGIVIADTKLEFGLDAEGELLLIDEVLTPDSSRFWPADRYQVGISPPSFDKQFVRDYLETLDWDKTAPGPRLPAEVIEGTARRYREARDRLIGPA